jgi:D-alanyl-D-alanine carboxypeptidase/D-alanyl-D-alanine-endopeptidase (penicillin-binding protein 4)
VKGSDPLAALNELAAKVRAAGTREIRGEVVIDDRLFATYEGWPDGVIAPIWVNENVIDITTTRTASGQLASVDWRPKSASLTIESRVTTVAAGKQTAPLHVEAMTPDAVRITGEIAADGKPILNIWQIRNPANFARTALIEALQREGVKVTATPTGSNPVQLLPADYAQGDKIAEHISPPLSEFVKVILKVSYNRGAGLMLCLAAAKSGSRDGTAGLDIALKLIASMGVSKSSIVLFDGAGSDERDRTSPADQVTFLRNVHRFDWGKFIRNGMAVVGVDGTQAQNQVGTPAAGHIQAKDGSRAATTPNDYQDIITAKTSVGYIKAKSGRQLVYAIYLANIAAPPSDLFSVFGAADHDIGAIAALLQQGL